MSIEKIVEQALQDGYLTPSMETEVGKICNMASELSIEEYMSLDRLMGALLTGEVVVLPRKHFINVMEELVLSEAIARVAEIEASSNKTLDVGDIAAYALNRLPPLYATTEEGAQFQRSKAKDELQQMISRQVSEAIDQNITRKPIHLKVFGSSPDVGSQLSSLLKSLANEFEAKDNQYHSNHQ